MHMPWPLSSEVLAPLASWFETHRRNMPWRAVDLDQPHPDPYAVLVSELMLQQTQVDTVLPYFRRWLERFPDAESLARATSDELHALWQGLGYYRRARFLHEAAKVIASHGWPKDRAGLAALPGVGPYTSAALASIAFQQPEPALDGNAFRVFARLLALSAPPKEETVALEAWLIPALRAHGPSRMTQAVMELGALVCQPQPRCEACPLAGSCAAHRLGLERTLPAPQPRPEPKRVRLQLFALEACGHWLLLSPSAKGLLAGLWRWPTVEAPSGLDASFLDVPGLQCVSDPWTQVYTHRREEVFPVRAALPASIELPGATWVAEKALPGLPMGKRDDRMRQMLSSTSSGPALSDSDAQALALVIRSY